MNFENVNFESMNFENMILTFDTSENCTLVKEQVLTWPDTTGWL